MKSIAASESIRRNRLGRDVLAFGTIRNLSLTANQQRLAREGASEGDQLVAAQARIAALEKAREDDAATIEFFDSETTRAEERAAAAEALHRGAVFRIQQLSERLGMAAATTEPEFPLPSSWPEFSDWCDGHFAGRVALAPPARRSIKSSTFGNLELAARCLIWLATTYRDGRLKGGEGDFLDAILESGVRNSPCGSDEFDLDWQGRRYTADWHIKSGGNTRDPQRCLRIYYFWEPETQQVVIADMPGHRRSSAT